MLRNVLTFFIWTPVPHITKALFDPGCAPLSSAMFVAGFEVTTMDEACQEGNIFVTTTGCEDIIQAQ